MAQLSFYKQVRNDGGTRYGIDIDENRTWMHFNAGSGIDPSLLWYVDVSLQGESLNGTPESARDVFLAYADQIRAVLANVSAELGMESDPLVWPVSREIQVAPGEKLKVVCSAIRQIPARMLAQKLLELRDEWTSHINNLEQVAPVSAN